MDNLQLRKIYDGFEVKDMSFADFSKEINNLSDPVKMGQDLSNIQILKAREKNTKQRIDKSLRRGK